MSFSSELGNRVFLLTSFFEVLFFCGFQTGWSSLVYVIVEEGIYSQLCLESSTNSGSNDSLLSIPTNKTFNNCPAQQEMLNLAYTLSTSISCVAAFPVGIAVDCVGPRIVRFVSGVMMAISCLLLSFLNKTNPGLLFAGLFIGSIASQMIYMTPQTCLNKFKKGRSIIIGIYCGAWLSSSLPFLVFKIFYEQGGVRFAHFFRFLVVSCVFVCINSALLYPDKVICTLESKQDSYDGKNTKRPSKKTLKKFSEIRHKLDKCKSCLGQPDTCSSKAQTINASVDKSEESSHLLRHQRPSTETSRKTTELGVSEKQRDSHAVDVTKSGSSSSQTEAVLNVIKGYRSSPYVLRTSCDFKKVTYAACSPVNSKLSSMKNTLSRTSLGEMKEKGSGGGECSCQEDTKQNCKPMELKPCRSTDLQAWTACSAEAYLRSGLSFKHCVLSAVHIWGEIFIVVCKIRLWFYVGTFSNYISELCEGNRQIEAEYVNIFGLSQLSALVFAPLIGLIVDRQSTPKEKEHVSPSDDIEKAHHKFMMSIEDTTKAVEFIIKCNKDKIYKLNDAVLVTACAAVVFCLLTLVPNLQVQIVTFQLYTFLRISYNALFASALIIIFPPNHLGKLMGLASFLGALFSLLQYPLFIIMEACFDGRLLEVNTGLWLLCMFTFGLPIYLWRKASSRDPHSLALVAV